MKKFVGLLCWFIFPFMGWAQRPPSPPSSPQSAFSQNLEAGPTLPIGVFSLTHVAGFQLEYSYGKHGFGRGSAAHQKFLQLFGKASASVYIGVHDKGIAAGYTYPLYYFFSADAGVLHRFGRSVQLQCATGPGFRLYNHSRAFGWHFQLQGTYYLSERVAIVPGVQAIKESIADPLYTLSLKLAYAF